jgi:hypothetical protein
LYNFNKNSIIKSQLPINKFLPVNSYLYYNVLSALIQ